MKALDLGINGLGQIRACIGDAQHQPLCGPGLGGEARQFNRSSFPWVSSISASAGARDHHVGAV